MTWLREAREAAGFPTAEALAGRIGAVTPGGRSLVSAWERGDSQPTWQWIEPLAAALNLSVDDTLEHLWDERPGDPCPCGCGGHKVPPTNPRAQKLPIGTPCARCGEERIYQRGKKGVHFALCGPCSQRDIIRFGQRPSRGSQNPFTPALRSALDRKGITLARACELAHLDVTAVSRWTGGRNGPFRDSVQSLADVLDTPELLEAIAWRWRRYELTCTQCDRIKEYRPGTLRAGQERGFHAEAVVDEATGEGTYICLRCKQSEAGRRSPVGRRIALTKKKHGRKALRRRVLELRAAQTPEQRREALEKAWAVIRGRPLTEQHRWKIAVGHIVPRPAGKFGICRVCGFTTYSKHPNRVAETHQECRRDYLRQHQSAFGRPIYPPRRRGRLPSASELADTFEMAVLHVLRRDQPEGSLRQLAQRFHMERQSVLDRIKSFIQRLPSEDRGGKQLTFWARALREEWARRLAA